MSHRRGHRALGWILGFATIGLLGNSANAIVIADWDGSINPWQSKHWAFTIRPGDVSTDVFPYNRSPDERYAVQIAGGSVDLLAPVIVDSVALHGAARATLTGNFDIKAFGLAIGNGTLAGSGVARVEALGLNGDDLKIIDGWRIDIGAPGAGGYGDASGSISTVQLNNNAVINSYGRFEFLSNNTSLLGTGGIFNSYGEIQHNSLGTLDFGPNISFNSFGEVRTLGTLRIAGGGFSLGHWIEPARKLIIDSGLREFRIGGTFDGAFREVELRSGSLALDTTIGANSFVMTGGSLAGDGHLFVFGFDQFRWEAGTMSGAGITRVAMAGEATISGDGGKSLIQRSLLITDHTTVSYTSGSDLVLRDGASIQLDHEPLGSPSGSGGHMIVGPVRGPTLGAFRYAGGEAVQFRNEGWLQIISPIDFVGVPLINQEQGLLTVDALGELRTDSPLQLDFGSTTFLLGGRITSALPVTNHGTIMGAGTFDGNLINAFLLQVGSNTPESDGILFLDVNGDLTLNEDSATFFPITGRSPRTQYGTIDVNGDAILHGHLGFDFGPSLGAWITRGDTFTLLTADTPITGQFSNIAPGGFVATFDGCNFQAFYGETSPFGSDRLVVACVPEPALFPLVIGIGLLPRRPRVRPCGRRS